MKLLDKYVKDYRIILADTCEAARGHYESDKNNTLYISIENPEICFCPGVVCGDCLVNTTCADGENLLLPLLTKKELQKLQQKYPEYFI